MKFLVIGNVGFDLMAPYLRSLGIETVLADATDNGLNANLADHVYPLDPEGWEPLAEVALREEVDAVISISGPDHRNLRDSLLKDFLESHYAIPTLANPPGAAAVAVDKSKTKSWLVEHGFPVTRGALAQNPAQANEMAKEFGFPLVLKSPCESGGVGMKICEDVQELEGVEPTGYPYLIEQFVAGPEFSVEVLNYGGGALPLMPVYKGLTNREAIHPMERVRLAPAPLDAVDSAHLRRLARNIVAGLELQPTADVDIVWSVEGPRVFEINPRFGGVTALSMAASGIVSYWALVDMILGRWSPARYRFNRSIAADMPIMPGAANQAIRELLDADGVFRIKFQRLKKTIGRIALTAHDPDRLMHVANLATQSMICDQDSLWELQDLMDLAAT